MSEQRCMVRMTNKSETRQVEILKFIYQQVEKRGYPPTVREIGEAVSLSSTSTVHGHLSRLEKNGYLFKDPSKPRAIELTAAGLEKIDRTPSDDQIPLLGVVAAGAPILAIEEATDYFPVPPEFKTTSSDLFMLTIKGESMINAGILDGDQVMVRKQEYANNGEIVIALTSEDEATCKRFYKENSYYRLEPENDLLEPIILSSVTILGKVVGLYRNHII